MANVLWRGGRRFGGSKYGAKKETVDGITFHSKREAARYRNLKALEAAGRISQLERQVRYRILVPMHLGALGELADCGSYIADFRYRLHLTAGGATITIVEDTKGFRTETYKLKKKLVEALYGVTIHET
jgi:hypothetical protein